MNSNLKITLGILAGLIVICVCLAGGAILLLRATGSAVVQSLDTDPAKAVEISDTIAEYTLPDGFGKAYATRAAGFSLVSHTGDDGHSHIYLFQLPASIHVDQSELERQLRDASNTDKTRPVNMKIVDKQPGKIAGQDVTLIVSEGSNHDNQPFREVAGMFQGRGGQALVVFSAPASAWDQALVDDFLASITE